MQTTWEDVSQRTTHAYRSLVSSLTAVRHALTPTDSPAIAWVREPSSSVCDVVATDDIEIREGFSVVNDVHIAFEDWGNPHDEAILLIMGLGASLDFWPRVLCSHLVREGYRVIRFDNRDVGMSTKFVTQSSPTPRWLRLLRCQLGFASQTTYALEDLAKDALGILDTLGIFQAHIVGASMGGMVAQIIAGTSPSRTLSLSLLFTSALQHFFANPSLTTLSKLSPPQRPHVTTEERIADKCISMSHSAGKRYPYPPEELRNVISDSLQRCEDSSGMSRHLDAICGTSDLRRYHPHITAPTCVIHGTADPIIPYRNGRLLARSLRKATFTVFDGMGHSLPPQLLPEITQAILTTLHRAHASDVLVSS